MTDRVRCFAVALERVYSGRCEDGTPVADAAYVVQACRDRGGGTEVAQMEQEVSRLREQYPEWEERTAQAWRARLEQAAR